MKQLLFLCMLLCGLGLLSTNMACVSQAGATSGEVIQLQSDVAVPFVFVAAKSPTPAKDPAGMPVTNPTATEAISQTAPQLDTAVTSPAPEVAAVQERVVTSPAVSAQPPTASEPAAALEVAASELFPNAGKSAEPNQLAWIPPKKDKELYPDAPKVPDKPKEQPVASAGGYWARAGLFGLRQVWVPTTAQSSDDSTVTTNPVRGQVFTGGCIVGACRR